MENENIPEKVKADSMKEALKIPYLPLGSVVLLKNARKRIMIYGRKIQAQGEEKVYDYVGCVYPEGVLGNKDVLLFDHNQIQLVYFIGFQDIEELAFRSKLHEAEEGI